MSGSSTDLVLAGQKACALCGAVKPVSSFYGNNASADGRMPMCKSCDKARRAVNKRIRHRDDRRTVLWDSARKRAYERRIPFDIELEDIELPERCPLLGTPLTFARYTTYDPNLASIDRIDNTKGYVRGNVWVVSLRANTAKGSLSYDEMRTMFMNWTAHLTRGSSSTPPG